MNFWEFAHFFCNKYKENSGNTSHMHGLIEIYEDETVAFKSGQEKYTTKLKDYITKVQTCGVGDIVHVDRMNEWKKGILNDLEDWTSITSTGSWVLAYSCDNRCM